MRKAANPVRYGSRLDAVSTARSTNTIGTKRTLLAMLKKTLILLAFAFAVWTFCGALVGIGRQFMSMESTLIVHAVGAPVGAAFLSWLYFPKYGFTSPLVTAAIFVASARPRFLRGRTADRKELRHVHEPSWGLDTASFDLFGDLSHRPTLGTEASTTE